MLSRLEQVLFIRQKRVYANSNAGYQTLAYGEEKGFQKEVEIDINILGHKSDPLSTYFGGF